MGGFGLSLSPGDPLTILRRLVCLLPILLLTSFAAKADIEQVYVSGSYAFADHGYGIGPYGGTLNGVAASFFCVDFSHDIVGQTGWNATVTNLGSAGPTILASQTTYAEFAWLITQMMDPSKMAAQTNQSNLQTVQAELQWTIWAMSGLGGAPNPYVGWTNYFSNQALTNYQSVGGTWEILTPNSGSGYALNSDLTTSPIGGYYGQEFMVTATPEPSSMLLLLAGLGAALLIGLLKK